MKIRDARFCISASAMEQLPPPAFAEVAFAGRSNVGKSSLINSLVERRKLVRTSNTPGCTRGINIFRIDTVDPEATFDFVDLPGYGYAKRSKSERKSWGSLIESFLQTRPGLRGVVVLADSRRGFEQEELDLIEFLGSVKQQPILVATKLDKIKKNERKLRLQALGKDMGLRVHGYSSETGEGREALWRTILRVASVGDGA